MEDYNFKDAYEFEFDYYIEKFVPNVFNTTAARGWRYVACDRDTGAMRFIGELYPTKRSARADAITHMMEHRSTCTCGKRVRQTI